MSRWKFGSQAPTRRSTRILFGPVGVLNQSGIVGTTTFSDASALRLESDYTYSDPDHALTYRAGDTIAGGLAWTRPIRMAGLQVQRDFTLRSDLVTAPLPQISGTAAVPSSVDVFVNGTKAYSQDVAPGPYSLTSLPLMAQNGVAQVVVRDATGREVDTNLNLFDPGRLLAPGLVDFSVESGFRTPELWFRFRRLRSRSDWFGKPSRRLLGLVHRRGSRRRRRASPMQGPAP